MNYKQILEQFGLVENVDFIITVNGFDKIAKIRQVEQIIHHPEQPAVMNGQTVISPAIPAYDETILVDETYFAQFPTDEQILETHKNISIAAEDISLLISEYLKGKDHLRDLENDSINIVGQEIRDWRFKNIPQPTRDDLFALIPALKVSQSKDAILKQIADLEAQITPRRVREAVLSGDNSFIASIDSQIATLRLGLV